LSDFFVYAQHNGEKFELHYVVNIDLTTGKFKVIENPTPSSTVEHELFDNLFSEILGIKPSTLSTVHKSFLAQRTHMPLTDTEMDIYCESGHAPREVRTHFIFNKDRIHQLHTTLGQLKRIPVEWLNSAAEPNLGGGGAPAAPVAAVPTRSRSRRGSMGDSESKAGSPDPSPEASPRGAADDASDTESSKYESVRPSQESSTTDSLRMSRVPSDLSQQSSRSDCHAALGGQNRRRLSTVDDDPTLQALAAEMERLEAAHVAGGSNDATDPESPKSRTIGV
jgi:hypothetical protein